MNLARGLVWALVVLLPLTAVLVFAAGDVLVPTPWSKHSPTAARASLRLPSGIAAPITALVAPPLLGTLAASAAPVAPSIALRPPFIPPRG
jgi:hypothetical protein